MGRTDPAPTVGSLDDVLAHYGIRGMKWGQHKGPVSASGYAGSGVVRTVGSTMTPKQHEALAVLSHSAHLTSANVGPGFHKDAAALNSQYDQKKFSNDAYYDKYRHEARRMYEKHVDAKLPEGLKCNTMAHPDRSRPGYIVIGNKKGLEIETSQLLKEGFIHSASSPDVVRCRLEETVDSEGFVTDMAFSNELKQSDIPNEDLDTVLAHYGIPGMRWGKHKAQSIAKTGPQAVKLYSSPGKRLKTSGGENHPASEDAKKSAAYRQQARQSTVDSLSNEQLRHLINRLNQEQAYAKVALAAKPKSAGRKFIEKLLQDEGKQLLTTGKPGPMGKMVGEVMKAKGSKHGPTHSIAKTVDSGFAVRKAAKYAGSHRS